MDTNKNNVSEESKRRGSSLRSNISKETYAFHNEILKMLDRITDESEDTIIENLKMNQYALKTALMMPIEEYVERNPESKVSVETYLKYGADEELYGLYLVIKSKSMKIFKYLWEERGTLWAEKHIFLVVQAMAVNLWAEGVTVFFALERTREIFISMYCNERKSMFDGFSIIAEELLEKNTGGSRKFLSYMMKALVIKPYSTLTFLNMFKYIHLTHTKIRSSDVDPTTCVDDLFILLFKKNDLHGLAENFDKACNSDLQEKKRYRNILTKLIDFSFIIMPSAIPISRIWKSIKIGSEEEFRKC